MILIGREIDGLAEPRQLADRWTQLERDKQADDGLRRRLQQGADAEAADAEPRLLAERVHHETLKELPPPSADMPSEP